MSLNFSTNKFLFFLFFLFLTSTCRTKKNDLSINAEVTKITNDLRRIYGIKKIPDCREFSNYTDSISAILKKNEYKSPSEIIDFLIKNIYDSVGMEFDTCRNNLLSVLPNSAMLQKKGTCLGVSLIYLIIAEKAKLPLYGVLLPTHFFVRYDDGNFRRNIEPNLHGFKHSDDYYKYRYNLNSDPRDYWLSNLSVSQTLAVLHFNIANILSNDGYIKDAIYYYKKSISLMGNYGESLGNYAILLAKLGHRKKAKKIFIQAFKVAPNMPGLSLNIGNVQRSDKNYQSAVFWYKKALSQTPDNPVIYHGIYLSEKAMRRDSIADSILKILLDKYPNYCKEKNLKK